MSQLPTYWYKTEEFWEGQSYHLYHFRSAMTDIRIFRLPPVEFEARTEAILPHAIRLLVATTTCSGSWTRKTTQRLLGARCASLRNFVADWVSSAIRIGFGQLFNLFLQVELPRKPYLCWKWGLYEHGYP